MKRATGINARGDIIKGISIHALVKRATYKVNSVVRRVIDFNPRPREEGDSFHCLYYTVSLYFNPRPREEGDKLFYQAYSFQHLFQSTPS